MALSSTAITVSELNSFIKGLFTRTQDLKNVLVKGEISNLSARSGSDHIYFSLKDKNSIIKCNFFSFQNRNYKGKPLQNGMEVLVSGNVSVYEVQGTYNIQVQTVEELGKGDIFFQIELLKKKLFEKGIFAPEHKKPIPFFPKRIGIATSPKGAAIEDIIKNALELNPYLQILVSPCLVQGDGAPESIVEAIQLLNDPVWEVDVIIAGRGGGATEDLMAFNDERVVMAFFESRIPIVSAVGHEIDHSLSDYAADQYTSTPTAAAKLVVPDVRQILDRLEELEDRLKNSLKLYISTKTDKLQTLQNRYIFQNPKTLLENSMHRLDEVMDKILSRAKNGIGLKRESLKEVGLLSQSIQLVYQTKAGRLDLAKERLENFSPLGTLKRGYSVLRNAKKEVLTHIKDVKVGEKGQVILQDGILTVEIQKKEKGWIE